VESDCFTDTFVYLNAEKIISQSLETAFNASEAVSASDDDSDEDGEMIDEESLRRNSQRNVERWLPILDTDSEDELTDSEDDLDVAFRVNARDNDAEGDDTTDDGASNSDSDSDYRYDSDDASGSSSEEMDAAQRLRERVQRTRDLPYMNDHGRMPLPSRLRVTAGGVMPEPITVFDDYLHRPVEFEHFN